MPDNLLMPEGSDPYYGQRYMPSQSLSAYQPTLRDQTAQFLQNPVNRFWRLFGYDTQDQKPSPEVNALVEGLTGSRGMGTTQMGLLDATPAGIPFAAQDAYRAGDDRALAMAIMPGPAKGVAQEAKAGIRAYHGSPHDFDRFDMSKIGTGEGAQAYGHGLYFAENEGVAKSYKDGLAKMAPSIDGKPVLEAYADGSLPQILADKIKISRSEGIGAANIMSESARTGRPVADILSEKITREKDLYGASTTEAWASKLREIAPDSSPGRLYEVRINADPNDFLDLDKGISEQPAKLQSALKEAIGKFRTYLDPIAQEIWGERFGTLLKSQRQDVYDLASKRGIAIDQDAAESWRGMLKDPKSTEFLRDSGIPGLKYFDAGSRDIGEGSRNYVVFRDDIIDIVKKYGIAAAASMYGMDAVNNAMGAANDQPQNLLMQGY